MGFFPLSMGFFPSVSKGLSAKRYFDDLADLGKRSSLSKQFQDLEHNSISLWSNDTKPSA